MDHSPAGLREKAASLVLVDPSWPCSRSASPALPPTTHPDSRGPGLERTLAEELQGLKLSMGLARSGLGMGGWAKESVWFLVGADLGPWKGNPGHIGNELEAAFILAFSLSDFRVIYCYFPGSCSWAPGVGLICF